MNSRYRILIQGKNVSYFVSLLIGKHVSIYQKEEVPSGVILLVDAEGWKIIQEIKTSYFITILNRYGIAKIQYLVHKYFVFLLGIVFFLGILFFLSHVIFQVDVVHSNELIRSIIYEDLKYFGIDMFYF